MVLGQHVHVARHSSPSIQAWPARGLPSLLLPCASFLKLRAQLKTSPTNGLTVHQSRMQFVGS